MNQMRHLAIAVLTLAACSPPASPPAPPELAAQAERVQLAAAGEPTALANVAVDDNLAWAASVVQLDPLTNNSNGGIKLFGLAGGDPAMNGLYTYLAFYESPAEDWRVFRLGDFLSYRVLSEESGSVALEIQESIMDQTSGQIGSRTRYAIVSWERTPDGPPPTSVNVTPAERSP
jgi:hypothetical protein